MKIVSFLPCWLALCVAMPGAVYAEVIGRPVRVVTLSFAEGRDSQEILRLTAEEAAKGTDLIVLPESWTGKHPEPVDGATTVALAALARKHRTYIVSPIYRSQGKECYNSAIVLDRKGKVACVYDKVFPFPAEYMKEYRGLENLQCGSAAKVFNTDFGKVGLAICFDINFADLWQQMADQGAEMVVWPSAYPGGLLLQARAAQHHYYVVSATHNTRATSNCPVFDITGEAITGPGIPDKKTDAVAIARFTLDLDRTIVGTDYGHLAQAAKLVKAHPQEIVIEKDLPHEGWFVMKAIAPGVRVHDLVKSAGIATLMEGQKLDREELARRRGAEYGGAR